MAQRQLARLLVYEAALADVVENGVFDDVDVLGSRRRQRRPEKRRR